MENKSIRTRSYNIRWMLMVYDVIAFAFASFLILFYYRGLDRPATDIALNHAVLALICVFAFRVITDIYRQIWRYGGIQSYLKLIMSDTCAFAVYLIITQSGLFPFEKITTIRVIALFCADLLFALAMRMLYRYVYKFGNTETFYGRVLCRLMLIFGRLDIRSGAKATSQKIKIAIVGAGRVGVGLAEELMNNSAAAYYPRCFIDINREKIGKRIYGIPVLSETEANIESLKEFEVQEVVFAVPQMDMDVKQKLYEYYRSAGYKIKSYDFPLMQTAGNGKRSIRDFDIEELLFRKPIVISDEETNAYYKGKRVLITGGGGSIGSELCRQIAKMHPERLIVLDVYENGAYDVQQELRSVYGADLDMCVEIVSVCNKAGLERVFREHKPQVVLNAAAHKHVPLMERNCIEAIENNIFGTLNTVELSEKYGVERFMMVSTDKAVNPTNVMGATKRMCELIVQAHSRSSTDTTFSATRFGNVLGSAGSVIPLFKRQIAGGGPITLTDKRIIRYFMTIPEASQLVLQSGAMAENGELFVLDMGKPVKILELAENMIRLSGLEPYRDINIIETGLRPGEKLYEELLVKTEELDKTANKMIFIERDAPLTMEELTEKLDLLRAAVATGSDDVARDTLRRVIPTFKAPEEINAKASEAVEMKEASKG